MSQAPRCPPNSPGGSPPTCTEAHSSRPSPWRARAGQVLTYFGFHEVARALEDPFLHPPNELPIIALQESFNTRLSATWEALDVLYNDTDDGTTDVPTQAGVLGVHDTPAAQLLEAWRARDEGLQAVPGTVTLPDHDQQAGPMELDSPTFGASRSGQRRQQSKVTRAAGIRKTGSHVRHSVHAQRLSVQLISVS